MYIVIVLQIIHNFGKPLYSLVPDKSFRRHNIIPVIQIIQACSIWMPLDPVSDETTIEFISGSHLNKTLYRARKFATSNNYPLLEGGDDQEYEDVPDVDSEREMYEIVKWQVQVGGQR